MCTKGCSDVINETDIPLYQLPLKLKLFRSLGLETFIINKFVKSYSRRAYTFPMKQLKYLITEECHIPVIHFPKVFPEDSMVLVYSHGSGSNLEHIYNVAKAIWKLYDVAVVIYDYTGCGNSKLADGMMEKDLIAVLSWVLKLGYSISNIILCGFSLGTYPTLSMPGQIPRIVIGGIIGLIPFIQNQIAQFKGQPFDNIQNCRKLKNTQILLIHSKDDTKVPVTHSRLLFTALTSNRNKDKVSYIQVNSLQHNDMMKFLTIQKNQQIVNFIQLAKIKRQLDIETLELARKLSLLKITIQDAQK